jgi:hypothetical protein
MIPQCWLHIGTEKTGSTSIQTFLAQNRAALLSRGWLYAKSAGARTHYSLVAFSLDDERHDATRSVLRIADRIGLDQFRLKLIDALAREIAASGAATLLLSNELLSARLRNRGEVARLKTLCDSLASKTKVIVYLRNQADFLVSRYTNVIWEGGTGDFHFNGRATIADYALLLDRWSEVFGKENIVIRRFEPSDFPDGDLLRDFADSVGLDIADLERPVPSNPSLDMESLIFLRAMNRRLPSWLSARLHPWRGALVRVLQRRRGGRRFVIPRTLAQRIEQAYADSNSRVSEVYFGARYCPLFSPPLLVTDQQLLPTNRIGPLAAVRIGFFLAGGLLRDRWIRARKRRLPPARQPDGVK